MNILKQIYKGGTLALLMAVAACSAEQFSEETFTPGTTPISPMGALTRGEETQPDVLKDYTNLYISSLIKDGDKDLVFFTNKSLQVATTVEADGNYKLSTSVYYPSGNKEIKLYAHTGMQTNGKIKLVSGIVKANNDILISNTAANGKEGAGTAGTSENNVQLLTFSHAMTKVEVAFEIVDDVEETKPSSIELTFIDSKVVKEGEYELAKAFDEAVTSTTGNYTLKNGINYLVANGATLSGNELIKSLTIDDYVATPADCKKLTVPQTDLESDFVLNPGLAYTLTFKIKRLKVEEITLTMKPWDIVTGDGSWGCHPYKVKMNFIGEYANSGEDAISKMVFHYTSESGAENYQYIAKVENGIAEFLTLPSDMTKGTLTADLYTANGLLIQKHNMTYTAASGTDSQKFGITLNANGMVKDETDTHYEVGTPLQFYNMMKKPEENAYQLIENIDISHLPVNLESPSFPTGATLDGDGHSILHLNLAGNGLFAENNGTLRNLHLAFSTINSSSKNTMYAGGICSVNNGTIEGCINEADVTGNNQQIVGGICGQNNGTILACLNTGNIPTGAEIGGICGENASNKASAIEACINTGMLHGSSNHGVKINIGGICGFQSIVSTDAIINTCYWLTGTARPEQGNSKEVAIGRFADEVTDESSQAGYCNDATNMTETILRTEGKDKLNKQLGASSVWKFEWKETNGTSKTVWPTPVKKIVIP